MDEKTGEKIGIIPCSGERKLAGTFCRIVARLVAGKLRPNACVLMPFPHYEFEQSTHGEDGMDLYFPVITLDGCGGHCAKIASERAGGRVVESINVTELLDSWKLGDEAGKDLSKNEVIIARVAGEVAERIDRLRHEDLMRSITETMEYLGDFAPPANGRCHTMLLPKSTLLYRGRRVKIIALRPIFEFLYQAGKQAGNGIADSLLSEILRYNKYRPLFEEEGFRRRIAEEYERYCFRKRMAGFVL